MTAASPVPAESLGIVMPHEHVLCDLSRELGLNGLLTDVELVAADLRALRAAGCDTLVEVSPREVRGDVALMAELAAATGLQADRRDVVLPRLLLRPRPDDAGHHRRARGAPGLRDRARGGRRRASRRRLDAVAPGADGSCGPADPPRSHRRARLGPLPRDPRRERAFRAAARAHHATALTITTHASRGAGLSQLALLEEEGVAPARVVVGHCDTQAEIERCADWVVRLVQAGHGDRVLLSGDVCVRSNHQQLGGRGYAGVLDALVPALRGRGLGEADVARLVAENPQRALSGA